MKNVTYAAGGGYIGVRWRDEKLTPHLDRLFTPWRTTSSRPDLFIDIQERPDGYAIVTPSATRICAGLTDLVPYIEYELTLQFQALCSNYLQVHAAGIERNGQVILLIGGHGSGKSTMTLAAIAAGCRALGDDIVLVADDNATAYGFPRPIKAIRNTAVPLADIVPAVCPVFDAGDVGYVYFTVPEGRFYAEQAEISRIVFHSFGGDDVRITSLGESDALARMLSQGFNYAALGTVVVERLLTLLRRSRPLQLSYPDYREGIAVIRELLA